MNFTIAATDSPVVWQCMFQAIEDYRLHKEKRSTTYEYEVPDGVIEITVKKLPTTLNVTYVRRPG